MDVRYEYRTTISLWNYKYLNMKYKDMKVYGNIQREKWKTLWIHWYFSDISNISVKFKYWYIRIYRYFKHWV